VVRLLHSQETCELILPFPQIKVAIALDQTYYSNEKMCDRLASLASRLFTPHADKVADKQNN
jgi:hypothetical protein